MSIFGLKKDNPDKNVKGLLRKILVLAGLNNNLQLMTIETKKKVENLKPPITISAESKGPLFEGKIFSFGNAGREKSVGYVVMRRGYITGISLSSERGIVLRGKVRVGVAVNEDALEGGDITLDTESSKYIIFDNPFLVEAGSVINFVCLEAAGFTANTIVAILFETKIFI